MAPRKPRWDKYCSSSRPGHAVPGHHSAVCGDESLQRLLVAAVGVEGSGHLGETCCAFSVAAHSHLGPLVVVRQVGWAGQSGGGVLVWIGRLAGR